MEWGEFEVGELFTVNSSKKIFHANNETVFNNRVNNSYPYVVRATTKNGQRGYIVAKKEDLNDGNTLSFAQDTFTVFYQKESYVTGNKVKVLKSKTLNFNNTVAQFIVASINNAISRLTWGTGSDVKMITSIKFKLPIKDKQIDFDFMEGFVAELEAQRVAELEAYLTVTGLKDTELTFEEEKVLNNFKNIQWGKFNLEKLFGKSTRGKRLKSADRIAGNLPFVTAGEADEGISDFISNNVEIFAKNTTTIDMFGSAKYRNYKYGGDDHIAVVHTENIPIYAAIFITAAIHKSSHNGQFDYGRNFYAKDADNLDILLPVLANKQPDYDTMQVVVSAIHKLVIKDVVTYADRKITTAKEFLKKE